MSIYRLKGTSGPLVNQSFRLDQRLLIGAAGDVPVTASGAPGAVAEVLLEEEGAVRLRVLDAGSGVEVCVNGEPVREVALAGGDEIRIGTERLILQAPGLRPERVLTEQAVRRQRPVWPWVALVAAVAAAAGTAWYLGWLEPLLTRLSGS